MQLSKVFTKQKMMRTVLWSMLPIYLFSIYLFGWRVLLVLLASLIAACVGEWLIMRMIQGDKAKVSEAALVTAALFTLTLPPTIPLWIAVVGTLFGIIFGKAIFGGFAKNIFNPALVGRAFIYVCFPIPMTVTWANPFSGVPGGFAHYAPGVDLATRATPIINMEMNGQGTPLAQMFLGNTAGSLGETSGLLIVLAAVYLIYTKTASWKIMASTLASGLLMSFVVWQAGAAKGDPFFAIASGGFLFGCVFMATDPVSAPTKDPAKILYGVLIGAVTVIIRTFSLFTEGMMFAILIANSFAPLMDLNVKKWQARRKAKEASPALPAQKAASAVSKEAK
ncbi:Na(+)-translocating NADH-quinone reductase subunit B [Clostridiaceae bacterium JG1575]|nr:Na(+)-translocating NADH-quinone reductase subunit B [Clostridiaceae bacterium JG1575]